MTNKFFLIIFLFFFNTLFSQKNNLYVYENYQDYISNKPIDYGVATGYGMKLGSRYIITNSENKKTKIKINKIWGFKIGNYLYRFNKKKNIPVSFLKNELGLFFYIEADFTLSKAIWGVDYSNSTDHRNDGYFYSNDLDSEIIEISKIVKIDNPSADLKIFIDCIKEANDRYGYQAQFNGYTKCILTK